MTDVKKSSKKTKNQQVEEADAVEYAIKPEKGVP